MCALLTCAQVSTLALGEEAQGTRCFTAGRPCGFVKRLVDTGALQPLRVWMNGRSDCHSVLLIHINAPADLRSLPHAAQVQCITLETLLRKRRNPAIPVDILV